MEIQRVRFVGDGVPNGVVLVEFKPPLVESKNSPESQTICAIADSSTPGLVKEAIELVKTHTPRTPI